MKKNIRSIIASVLTAGLLVSGVNCPVSYAAETTTEQGTEQTVTEETVSDEAVIEETVTDETAAEEAAAEETVSEETAAEEAAAEETVSDEAVSEEEVSASAELTTLAVLDAKDILTAVDTYGNPYYPYQTADGNYVLFASSDMDLAALTVTLNEEIVSADKGTIDDAHVLTGAFTESGSSVTLTDISGQTYAVSVMQSSLPSMHITLSGTDLATINAGSKDTKYSGNSITLYDPDGNSIKKTEGLEIKGRGNSTWVVSQKKPYQIKFDKKTSVLGMEKAKKWVLLANAFDDSLVRNSVGFDIAKALGMENTPDYRFIDLWVDGEYRGNYVIAEKVEIGDGRVELSDENGVIMEYDQPFHEQEDFWTQDPVSRLYFTLKETNTSGNEEAQMKMFTDKFGQMYSYLANTAGSQVTLSGLSRYVDVESLAKYYLVTEFSMNIESWSTSFYWYMDGADDVIHCGPIWDVDSSMGLYNNYSSYSDYYAFYNVFMNYLLKAPAFVNYVKSLYTEHIDAFKNSVADCNALAGKISASADMNYARWDFLGKANGKPNLAAFKATYKEAVSSLSEWLTGRIREFDPAGKIQINQSEGNINITVKGISDTSSLRVGIWSVTNGQDDLKWVTLTKNSAGAWKATVPLRAFADDGDFIFHFYNAANTIAATATVYLKLDYSSDPPSYLYNDVQDETAWYYDAVADVTHKGLMTGLSSHIFGPAELTSRAQIAMILYRMAGSPEVEYQDAFSDVKEGEWYTDAVIWGYQNGVINGYENGKFGPSDQVTREQFATLLYRYMKAEKPEGNAIGSYPDAGNVSAFAKDAMNWAVSEGIITGKELGGTRRLMPQDKASRAEIAQMLTRL